MASSERDLQKAVLEWLKHQKFIAYAFETDTSRTRSRKYTSSKKGLADIIGCLSDGRFFAIELKVGYNQASDEQSLFLFKIQSTGAPAFLARSLEEVKIRFQSHGLK